MIIDGVADFNALYEKWTARIGHEKVICCFDEREINAGEFDGLVTGYMNRLHQSGIVSGNGVGYTMPNCPEALALFFAVARMGAYAVPVFPMVPEKMKVSVFKQSRARVVVTVPQMVDALVDEAGGGLSPFTVISTEHKISEGGPSVTRCDGEKIPGFQFMPAMMASSSGTTGIPKVVMINQMNMLSSLRCSAAMADPLIATGVADPSTVIAFPLVTPAVLVCAGLLFAGVSLVFSQDLSPVKYLELIRHWSVPSMSAPPSYFEALCAFPHLKQFNVSSVRNVMTGMDFFSPLLFERIRMNFLNVDSLSSGYGLVETSTVVMVHNRNPGENLSGAANVLRLPEGTGHSIAVRDENGVEVSNGESGMLWIKGPSVVKEYTGNPEETENAFIDGWFKTGDVARKQDECTVELMGRNKYLIKRGGKSVSPLVVQEQIGKTEGVYDSAVVGVPHQLYGEMIVAFVVVALQGAAVEKEIMKQCRSTLPNYMVPDAVYFVEEIPKKQGVGKVDVEQLQAMAKKEIATLGGERNG